MQHTTQIRSLSGTYNIQLMALSVTVTKMSPPPYGISRIRNFGSSKVGPRGIVGKGGVRRCIENCEEGIAQCFSFSAVVNLQGKPGESSAVGPAALDKHFGIAWGVPCMENPMCPCLNL